MNRSVCVLPTLRSAMLDLDWTKVLVVFSDLISAVEENRHCAFCFWRPAFDILETSREATRAAAPCAVTGGPERLHFHVKAQMNDARVLLTLSIAPSFKTALLVYSRIFSTYYCCTKLFSAAACSNLFTIK